MIDKFIAMMVVGVLGSAAYEEAMPVYQDMVNRAKWVNVTMEIHKTKTAMVECAMNNGGNVDDCDLDAMNEYGVSTLPDPENAIVSLNSGSLVVEGANELSEDECVFTYKLDSNEHRMKWDVVANDENCTKFVYGSHTE